MLLIANLDYETELARRRGIHIELPKRVRRMLAAVSTLMAALARDGDRLWTIEPVDARRVVGFGGALPAVELLSGAKAEAIAGETDVIAWGDLNAAEWNDRRFGFVVEERLGPQQHPGTRLIGSLDELESHLAGGGASEGAAEAWVVKAPLSASGRHRLRRRGRVLDEPSRTRVQRLLSQFGQLLFEPWVDRLDDYGCCGAVNDNGVSLFAPHVLLVDRAGVFRGIGLEPIADDVAEPITASARRVGDELRAAGYRGAFGVDSYRYRDRTGVERMRSFCELNARYTFGHIAWALAERIGEPIRLHIGQDGAPDETAKCLLAPRDDEPTSCWWSPLKPASLP